MAPRAKKIKPNPSPWTFRGEVFTQEMAEGKYGFVYMITCLTTGKKYIGKKFFIQKRKAKGAKRRSTSTSDWEHYWSSCAPLKAMVKENGQENFKREILSVHELMRDVNYCEVREMWKRDVLETLDENGERVYLNENIQGKFFPGLYMGWKERSQIAE